MSNMINATHSRLKAAQRDLIALCGGVERGAEISGYSSSHAGRWNNPRDADLMPLGAVLALEADCGVAVVTSVMAQLNGRRLMEPDSPGRGPDQVFAHHAETVRRAGELMAAGAAAFADGRLTPAEMSMIDRAAGDVERALAELRKAIGHGKADGGQVVELRGGEA